MANEEHLGLINQGVEAWNRWRREHAEARPDLSGANLSGVNLSEANLSGADLRGAHFREVNLSGANLAGADLSGANLSRANLYEANLSEADLRKADLSRAVLYKAKLWRARLDGANLNEANLNRASLDVANLSGANLSGATLMGCGWSHSLAAAGPTNHEPAVNLSRANLSRARLDGANFMGSWFSEANLIGVNLSGANLSRARLDGADLTGADLTGARLVETHLENANLNGCRIYGISAWNIKVNQKTKQSGLIITNLNEATVKVDDIQVAQFIHLILKYENLRNVLNAVTKRGVLILGRFGGGGVEVLRELGEALRQSGYLPMIFEFERPEDRNYTETVQTLAGLSRFVVVDLSGPSVPAELSATVPHLKIPFVPILEKGRHPYSTFADLLENEHMLPIVEFDSVPALIQELQDKIVSPAEKRIETRQAKLKELFG